MKTILPSAYLGSVHYFARLCFSDCVIEQWEHFVKQSMRSRCAILTAGGPTLLTVPVVKFPNDAKEPMRIVRIDNSKRWQHRHWTSIVSAYRASPYFDFYEEHFAPFYSQRYDLLFELNTQLTELILKLTNSTEALHFTEKYIPAGGDIEDLRSSMSEKPRLHVPDSGFTPAPYYQVFSGELGFTPNLSIIDLLFCEGPGARDVLRKCTEQ